MEMFFFFKRLRMLGSFLMIINALIRSIMPRTILRKKGRQCRWHGRSGSWYSWWAYSQLADGCFFPPMLYFLILFFSSQVTSAFGILILVMSIYAVMAVDLFSVQDSENFGNLSRALFTIFQVTFFSRWFFLFRWRRATDGPQLQSSRWTLFIFLFFQVTTGDGWSSVAKQQMDAKDENKFDRGIGFFFISIVLVCGIAMLVE
jgi:hypothetical protein